MNRAVFIFLVLMLLEICSSSVSRCLFLRFDASQPSTAQQNLLNVVSTQEYQIASLREEVESLKQQLQEAQSRIEQMEAVQPQANGAPGDKITQGE